MLFSLTKLHAVAARIADSNTALRWIFVFIALAVAVQFIIPLWWVLQSSDVVTEPAMPRATLHGKPVTSWEAGQTISIEREICAVRDYTGELLRTLWGNGAMPLPHELVTLKAGCQILRTYIALPSYLLPAEYVLVTTIQIRLNPLRTITVSLRSISVVVTTSPVTSEVDQIWKALRTLTAEHAQISRLRRSQETIRIRQEKILQYLTQFDLWIKAEMQRQKGKTP